MRYLPEKTVIIVALWRGKVFMYNPSFTIQKCMLGRWYIPLALLGIVVRGAAASLPGQSDKARPFESC
jgi:hypothetical protein